MQEQRARQTANVLMAAAAFGAAVLVLRNPRLRRLAWQLARQYVRGPLATWTGATVRGAWEASAPLEELGSGEATARERAATG